MRQVKFLGAARADLRTERAYYRNIDPELGRRFVAAVEETTKAITAHPLAMQVLEFEVCRWPVAGFPHGVLYRVDEPLILVLAVFHPKQDPRKCRRRALA